LVPRRDGQLNEKESLVEKVIGHLEKEHVEEATASFVNTAKQLLAAFQSLRRVSSDRAQEIAELLLSCQKRMEVVMKSRELNVQEEIGKEQTPLVFLHDNLLVLMLVLFSVYEHFYKDVLYEILHSYLTKQKLVSRLLEPPQPSAFEEQAPPINLTEALSWPYLSIYQFPLMVRVLVSSSESVTNIFASIAELSLNEAKARSGEIGDNLMLSMSIRNRIAHMSERVAYYSLEPSTMKRNLQYLAIYLPMVAATLRNLFLLFSKLCNESPLEIKSGRREAILENLLRCIDEEKFERVNDISDVIAKAILKLQRDPDTPNERLFKS
jgi:hypothetical protein